MSVRSVAAFHGDPAAGPDLRHLCGHAEPAGGAPKPTWTTRGRQGV